VRQLLIKVLNTYRTLSNSLLSSFTPYAVEIIRDHQSEILCSSSTTDHIFCVRQLLEMKWEYNEDEHQLFIDFKRAYDSASREAFYNILTEFCIPNKTDKVNIVYE